MRKQDSTSRRGRLRAIHTDTARELRMIISGRIKTLSGNRQSITFQLRKLAEAAGISREGLRNDEIYTEAIYALKAQGKPDDHPRAKAVRETIKRIRSSVLNNSSVLNEQPPTGPAKSARCYVDLTDSFGAENIGYIDGERLLCEDDPSGVKVGDAAAAWYEGEYASVGRVVAADTHTFTIREVRGEEYTDRTFERARVRHGGRVIGTCPRYSSEDEARLIALGAELERLAREDDQILRCTERYRIEREIYDIEHPPAGLNDWSEWEEDEEDE